MKRILIIIFIMSCYIFFSFAAEKSGNSSANAAAKEQYLKERISFKVIEEFDVMYPMNINKFEFFKGDQKLTLDDFIKLSSDPLLIKNQQKVTKVKLAGFTTAGVFGVGTALFLIPAIVFTVQMTNYNPVSINYIVAGVICYGFAGASLVGLFIDLIVTFSLLYKFQFSIQAVQQAVDNFNEKIRNKLGILPDMSFNENSFNLDFSYKF